MCRLGTVSSGAGRGARSCDSCARHTAAASGPEDRDDDVGFRLARGPEREGR